MSHRATHVVVGSRMLVFRRQAVGRQHHLASRGAGQMNGGGPVHLRAAKGKRPTVDPHQGPFLPFFPGHHSPLPCVLFDPMKLAPHGPGSGAMPTQWPA